MIIPKKNIFNWRIAIVYVLLNSITTIPLYQTIPDIECKLKMNAKLILVKKILSGFFLRHNSPLYILAKTTGSDQFTRKTEKLEQLLCSKQNGLLNLSR